MTGPTKVLVVDDEESLRHMLSLALSKDGFQVWTAASGSEGLDRLAEAGPFDVCLADVRMPGMDGLTFVEKGVGAHPGTTFMVMSAYGDDEVAFEALRRGAFDYVAKPLEPADLCLKIKLIVERRAQKEGREPSRPSRSRSSSSARNRDERQSSKPPRDLAGIVGEDRNMRDIFSVVRKVASFPTTVLITGETGTGKELIAGALHAEGKRRAGPFVAVNCGAIPATLIESELFGYRKNAFTNAAQEDRAGLFEVANGGTLFLDEIADLPLELQPKLLRALNEREIRRVGDVQNIPIDVRVVAATAKDIEAEVEAGRFRQDLFFRLNVVRIAMPALRDRPTDVRRLAGHFVHALSERLALAAPGITEEALDRLAAYHWPGNVRELENALERALVLSGGEGRVTEADLDERFDPDRRPATAGLDLTPLLEGEDLSLKVVIHRVESILIKRALERTGGNRTKAASLLGISQRALLYKLKDHGIS